MTERPAEGPAVDVAVVGSINLDLSIAVPRLPRPGETMLGGDALWSPGGKGANQAVAAARLGRRVAMVGCVGDDGPGRDLLAALVADGIGVDDVLVLDDAPSGVAAIGVDESGENSIIVSPGANGRVTAGQVEGASCVDRAAVILVQFEIPLPAVGAAARTAAGTVIVNPAPAVGPSAELDAVLARAGLVVPNREELSTLLGFAPPEGLDDVVDQARQLASEATVIVTLGADGAIVVAGDRIETVAPVAVDAVDTTAAGDAFCGGLADAIATGADVVEAARWAVRVAGVAVTRRGAQSSLPSRSEVSRVR